MHFVRRQTSGCVNGVIVSKLNVRQVQVPVVLAFIHHHRQHLGHGVVDAFDATVATGVVSARGDLSNVQQLENGGGKLGVTMSTIV